MKCFFEISMVDGHKFLTMIYFLHSVDFTFTISKESKFDFCGILRLMSELFCYRGLELAAL